MQDHGKEACSRVLACNHLCGGVRAERTCLPCLFGCAGADDAAPLRQDADDMCMICFTDPLQAAPALQVSSQLLKAEPIVSNYTAYILYTWPSTAVAPSVLWSQAPLLEVAYSIALLGIL